MSTDERDGEIQKLVHWFKANGGWMNSDIRIAFDQSHGFHMKAVKKLDAPFSVATCPLGLTLSSLNLDQNQKYVPCIDSKLQTLRRRVPDHVLTYLLLIEQLALEEESQWYPYVNLLPDQEDLTTALWFTAEDNKYLEGTPLLHAAGERNEKLRQEYENARSEMRDAGLEGSDIWDECDIDTFIWAATILDSRSFTSKNILPDLPAFPILFPVIDIANHWVTTKARWEYPELGDKRFTLNVLDSLPAGSEVFNNYGPKQNEQLLLAYGFAIPDNPVEQVSLKLAVHGENFFGRNQEHMPFGINADFDNEAATNVSYLRTPNHILGRYKSDVPFFRGFPPNVVFNTYTQALRIRNMDIDEAQQFSEPGRLALGTMLLLYGAIQIKCAKMRWPYDGLPNAMSAKRRYACIYRHGQAKIWHAMRRELKSVLERLRVKGSEDLSERAVIVTFDEALTAIDVGGFPERYDQLKKGLLELSLNDEEEKWVILLAFLMMITTPSGTFIDEWILYDLIPYYPEVDAADVDLNDEEFKRFSTLFERLKELDCGSVSQTVRECSRLPQIITWAIRVAYCELFCLPDSQDTTLVRHCMYFQPLPFQQRDHGGAAWMFEEVEILEQEPADTLDVRIYQGKFGH